MHAFAMEIVMSKCILNKPQPPTVPTTCQEDDRKTTSVYVRWQAPTFPNGDILYYLIDRESGPTTLPQFNTSTDVLMLKVEPLLKNECPENHLKRNTYFDFSEKEYCFRVKTVNDGPDNIRTSVQSQDKQCCTTKAGLATVPTSVMHSTTSRSIQMSWSKPDDSKGAITGYRLRVLSNNVLWLKYYLNAIQAVPMWLMLQRLCPSDKRLIREGRNSTELMSSMAYEIDKLLPYSDYVVWINAINAAGDGERNETSVQTDSEVPQKPLSVIASVVSSSEITVTWNQPPPKPGVTTYYVEAHEVVGNAQPKFVKFSNLTGFSPQTTKFSGLEAYWNYTFSVVAATDKGNSEQSEMSIITSASVNATMDKLEKIFKITPEKNYNIKVYAVNTEGTTGDAVEKPYDAKPGPPNVPNIPALVEEIAAPLSTQTTIKVKFSLDWFLNTDNGERTDGESKAVGFTIAYRVTSRTWIEDNRNTTGRRKRSNQEVELTIGEESGCDKLEDDVYCNGPLPADIRILGGCTESEQFGPYKTQPEPEGLPIAIIAGAVSAVVVFLIVIIIIICDQKQKGSRRNQPTKLEENEIDNFTNLNPHGLETPSVERKNIRKEKELKTLTDPKTLKNVSNSLAETEENKLKNRYVNILPYDHTIVKLLPLEDDDEQASTFINANYIPGYKSQREYIASQGPIPSTIDDFWRMVWEQSVSIIVMLTLAKEDGRIKCEMYWPTEQSEAKQFGDIVVEMQSCSTINTYEFRIFKMTLGDKPRTLKHFHFLNWKDFSANVQNDVMVDFISNQQYIFIHDCIKDILEKKRQKELEDGMVFMAMLTIIRIIISTATKLSEPEPELYQNFEIGQPKTEL
ncbi:PTPB [Mytilus edulis]|uniref:PTPRB n=1 Tax=Mytilus edulis TaxID=6550 RepID=A0A8S3R0S1_MYTED|nr:PTPB [Mytilus edulis]